MEVHEPPCQQINDGPRLPFRIIIRLVIDPGKQIACTDNRVDLVNGYQDWSSQAHHPEHATHKFRIGGRRFEKSQLSSFIFVHIQALQPAIGQIVGVPIV